MADMLRQLPPEQRKNLSLTGAGFFFILVSYPFIRVPATSLFLHTHTATNSPVVWLLSVVTLCLFIGIYDCLQRKYSIRRLYLGSAVFSLIVFTATPFLLDIETYYTTYALFIWKEAYIMLMLSLMTGFINVCVSGGIARIIWGPLGFLGSLGGIVGGLSTSFLSELIPVEFIPVFGCMFILLSLLAFCRTTGGGSPRNAGETKREGPLASIRSVKKYVFLVALLIIATQFCLTLANFKFNVLFDALITDKATKAKYLADLYTQVNVLAGFIQIFITPFILHRIGIGTVHLLIPLAYIGFNFLPLFFSGALWPVAIFFIALKGIDYSLFSASKEILYFSLDKKQRYGAKYIADAFCYRLGKGLISFVLIYVQSPFAVDALLWVCLVFWTLLLWFLFRAKDEVERSP